MYEISNPLYKNPTIPYQNKNRYRKHIYIKGSPCHPCMHASPSANPNKQPLPLTPSNGSSTYEQVPILFTKLNFHFYIYLHHSKTFSPIIKLSLFTFLPSSPSFPKPTIHLLTIKPSRFILPSSFPKKKTKGPPHSYQAIPRHPLPSPPGVRTRAYPEPILSLS